MTSIDIDDNLVQDGNGAIDCRHCGTNVGQSGTEFLESALWREQPSTAAGDSIIRAEPSLFVDRQIVLRQAFCPGCLTLLLTEVVPEDEPHFRSKTVNV